MPQRLLAHPALFVLRDVPLSLHVGHGHVHVLLLLSEIVLMLILRFLIVIILNIWALLSDHDVSVHYV